MKIANIYSVKNQSLYQNEEYVMILAHLLKKGLYKASSFNENQYIIMDNGLYEESQVSTNLQDLIDMVDNCPFRIHEVIVPDVLNDCKANIKMFEDNLLFIKKYDYRIRFMFVAQAATIDELKKSINFINRFAGDVNLSVGISKLCPFDRDSKEVIDILKECKFPIHYLGIKTTFKELIPVKDIIRSCDTSQLSYIAKNEPSYKDSIIDFERSGRREDGRGIEGIDINLEEDQLDEKVLIELKNKLDGEINYDK